jgi:hypothetical protein
VTEPRSLGRRVQRVVASVANSDRHGLLPIGVSRQSSALGDLRESPSPILRVSVSPPAVWDAVGMRGTLWTTHIAINSDRAPKADFYWVSFSAK